MKEKVEWFSAGVGNSRKIQTYIYTFEVIIWQDWHVITTVCYMHLRSIFIMYPPTVIQLNDRVNVSNIVIPGGF